MKHRKQIARDFPSGSNLSVKGRPSNPTLTKFVPPMPGTTGKRWAKASGPKPVNDQLWRFLTPSGFFLYASTSGGKGWERIK